MVCASAGSEMGAVLEGLGVEATPEQVQAFIRQCDVNGDGQIQQDEFVRVSRPGNRPPAARVVTLTCASCRRQILYQRMVAAERGTCRRP